MGHDDHPTATQVGCVSGSGTSTIAGLLAGQLSWDLAEGDDMHPSANVEKMRAGHPLTDEDRWPRLTTVASWITDHTGPGGPASSRVQG